MPPILQLDIQQIVSQAISFVLLIWVLRRFAWRPILAALDARRARIEAGFREIADGRAQLERLQQELAQRLAKIDDEARLKIQQAILAGKRIAIEVQEEARAQAQAVLSKAQDDIEMEVAKAKVALRNEIADMTVDTAERLLKQRCDEAADRKLIASIIDELGETPVRG